MPLLSKQKGEQRVHAHTDEKGRGGNPLTVSHASLPNFILHASLPPWHRYAKPIKLCTSTTKCSSLSLKFAVVVILLRNYALNLLNHTLQLVFSKLFDAKSSIQGKSNEMKSAGPDSLTLLLCQDVRSHRVYIYTWTIIRPAVHIQ